MTSHYSIELHRQHNKTMTKQRKTTNNNTLNVQWFLDRSPFILLTEVPKKAYR